MNRYGMVLGRMQRLHGHSGVAPVHTSGVSTYRAFSARKEKAGGVGQSVVAEVNRRSAQQAKKAAKQFAKQVAAEGRAASGAIIRFPT